MPLAAQLDQLLVGYLAILDRRQGLGDAHIVVDRDLGRQRRRPACRRRARDEILDHAGQSEPQPVSRVVDSFDAVILQGRYLGRRNRTAPATE